jgi:hypothetical protein
MSRRRSIALAFALGVFCLGNVHVGLAQSKADEYRLKAAYLFHFVQFVDWPADTAWTGPGFLTLCTVGEDPFHGDLETAVAGKSIGIRSLRVLHLTQAQDVQGCQVLFVSIDQRPRVPLYLAKLKTTPVLTVGDTEEFVEQGGTVAFCLEGKKLRFAVNLDAAQRSGLNISSNLLVLAKRVIGNRKPSHR